MTELTILWQQVGAELDDQLHDDPDDDEAILAAHKLVDDAFSRTCSDLRDALNGVACLRPTEANRVFKAHRTVDWRMMNQMPDGFVISKVRSRMESLQDGDTDAQGGNRPSLVPNFPIITASNSLDPPTPPSKLSKLNINR